MIEDDVGTKLVSEVMSEDIPSADPDMSVTEAAKLLKKGGRGSIAVKKGDEVLGIVTNSDIINEFVADEKRDKVKEIMTEDLVDISPDKTIQDAAILMVESGVERLLVTEGGEVTGVISANDIIEVSPSLYLDLTQGLKLGEESFPDEAPQGDEGQCESCENYSENLREVDGRLLCPQCREEM